MWKCCCISTDTIHKKANKLLNSWCNLIKIVIHLSLSPLIALVFLLIHIFFICLMLVCCNFRLRALCTQQLHLCMCVGIVLVTVEEKNERF